ncbi:hypothetical protein [Streptomyces sp. NPDC048565]|uniref:hypothetical protein n=1 Tax=Streptomyces sp. NPDC048565 TaxID=3155266 RepID=UPI00343C599B
MLKLLILFYATVSALATVAIPTATLFGFALVARPVRMPGRLLNRWSFLRDRTASRVENLINEAEGALDGMGVQHPTQWGEAELKVWDLAERGRRVVSVSLLLLCLTTIGTGALLTTLVEHRWDMALEIWLPSYAFLLLTACYVQLDLVAVRRGRSPAYAQWAAVSTLVACQTQADDCQATSVTTAELGRNVKRLSAALITYAQFGVSHEPGPRAALLAQCAGMSQQLEGAFVASLRDRSKVTMLAQHIVHLIEALGRQEPLSMVPSAECAPAASVPVEGPVPWRMVMAHFLAFLTGLGLIAGSRALGLSADYLILLAPLIYLVVQTPYLTTGRIPIALRHLPRLTAPIPEPASENEVRNSSSDGSATSVRPLLPTPQRND